MKMEKYSPPVDLNVPFTEFHELAKKIGTLQNLKTENESSNAAPGAAQPCTPMPQTLQYLKTELLMEEEFSPVTSDSEKHSHEVQETGGSQQTAEKKKLKTRNNGKTKTLSKNQAQSKGFACGSCKKKFTSQIKLYNHLRVHIGNTFDCELCGARFTQKGRRKAHMLRAHPDEAHQFTQDAATPTIAGENEVNSITTGASTSEDSVTCKLCHTIYSKELFSRHMRMAHCKKRFKCDFCTKFFKISEELKAHLLMHERNGKEKSACHSSDEPKLSTPHTGQTYNCGVCEARFAQKGSLEMHMRFQHSAGKTNLQTTNALSLDVKTELISDEEL